MACAKHTLLEAVAIFYIVRSLNMITISIYLISLNMHYYFCVCNNIRTGRHGDELCGAK